MNSEEISQQLEQYNQEVALIRAKLDKVVHASKEAMPKIAADWMENEVKRQIHENSKKVEKWDVEKMRGLKTKLKELTDGLPEIVESEFSSEEAWPHHDERIWDTPPSYGETRTGFIDSIFRKVISRLGNILSDYDFLDATGRYPSWNREGETGFRFSISLETDKKPELQTGEYDSLYREYKRLGNQTRDAQVRLSEAKAKEMWDEA